MVGGSLSETTWQGGHSDVQRDDQFCIADEQNASGSGLLKTADARRQVACTLAAVTYGRRDYTSWVDRGVSGPNLDDLDYVRDVVDLFAAGQFASNKYQRGKLAGLAVSWSRHAGEDPVTSIEIVGPLFGEGLNLEPVGWLDELPPLGWRDEKSNTLYRVVDLAAIAHLAAEAGEAAKRRDIAQNLFDLNDGSDSNRQAQADGQALRDASRTGSLVDLVCALNRCKFVGLAPDDDATSEHEDDIAYRADTLEWMFEGDDDFVVHLKTSSPQKLQVIVKTCDGEDVEHVLGRIRDLSDVLGDRVEDMRSAGVRGLK